MVDAFVVEAADGTIHGKLAWGTREDYVRTVQRLLIQHGAEVGVDGEWDTSTERAWADLLGEYGAEPGAAGTVPSEIGFPPADFLVESLDAAG